MTKEDILKEVEKLGLLVEISQTDPGEFIYIYTKNADHYIRLLNYRGKWYGCRDGKVGIRDVSETWVWAAMNELKGGKR